MSGPTTSAGRALLEHMTEDAAGFVSITSGRFHIRWVLDALAKDIPAIEAEAIATYAATLRERIEGLREHRPAGIGPVPHEIRREAFREVLALLDEARTAE